jgi:hypothetical protein
MSGHENANRSGGAAITTEAARYRLYQAVKAHASHLEVTRAVAAGLDLEVLDRRIEATRLLSGWLSQALGLGSAPFPEARMPSPSSAQADRGQIPPSARDTPKNSERRPAG